MEVIIYPHTSLERVEAFQKMSNKKLIIESIQAVIEGLGDVIELVRVEIDEDRKVIIYSPYAVCIVDGQNTIILEKEDIRKIYISLHR